MIDTLKEIKTKFSTHFKLLEIAQLVARIFTQKKKT